MQKSQVRGQDSASVGLTDSQSALLRKVAESSGVRLDSVLTQLEDARTLIELGLIQLGIIQLPWGVEFELVASR